MVYRLFRRHRQQFLRHEGIRRGFNPPSSRSKKPKSKSRKLTNQISDTTRAGKGAKTTTTSIDIVLIACPNELHRAFLAEVPMLRSHPIIPPRRLRVLNRRTSKKNTLLHATVLARSKSESSEQMSAECVDRTPVPRRSSCNAHGPECHETQQGWRVPRIQSLKT